MRPGPTDEALAGTVGWEPVVSSWLGGRLLAAQVPVSQGRITWSASQDVPESLTMTVPRVDGEMDWCPGADTEHPLARYGQELDVSIRVTSSVDPSAVWLVRVARVLITGWSDDDEQSVTVTGKGVLHRLVRARLTSPMQPVGSLVSEVRRLLPAGMGLAVDSALVDRACPAGMSWSGTRLAAVREVAAAWPALVRADEWGQVRMRAPLGEVLSRPALRLHDGERGTVVAAPRSDDGDDAYNVVVARSSAAGVEDVQAVARWTSGPLSADGPLGEVVREWSSPLITTAAQAEASARTMLESGVRPASVLPVTCASDPRVELDDPAEVVRDGVRTWGRVVGVDLPLTVADGDMRVDVSVGG